MKKLFSLALWSILLSFIIALVFSGCTTYRNLNLSKIQEFKQDVLQTYPLSQVTCKYDYESGVTITINRLNYSEECAYTILNYLRPIVRDEVFIQELFELFEKESNGDPNWKNGVEPLAIHVSRIRRAVLRKQPILACQPWTRLHRVSGQSRVTPCHYPNRPDAAIRQAFLNAKREHLQNCLPTQSCSARCRILGLKQASPRH